jgi:menaquinone-9 beta-reductase
MSQISIIGAGPAGCAAALAALSYSDHVQVFEQSGRPKHKVCGEFLSPEIAEVLAKLGVWQDIAQHHPAIVRHCIVHVGRVTKRWRLPEPGYGFSRYQLDSLLRDQAIVRGAVLCQKRADVSALPAPVILSAGRRHVTLSGDRLFGFKAHFEGPTDDAVELHFFRGTYVGMSSVEDQVTNVCGISSESILRECGFDPGRLVGMYPPLVERMRPLRRRFKWLLVGPLRFARELAPTGPYVYPAGDALGFIDPFTGSGILNALLTGAFAGEAAARGLSSQTYIKQCQSLLRNPYRVSSLLRALLNAGIAEHLAPLIPGSLLFRLTRAAGRLTV